MGNLLVDLLLEEVTLDAPIAISANIYLATLTLPSFKFWDSVSVWSWLSYN